jgi:hypothetical protein
MTSIPVSITLSVALAISLAACDRVAAPGADSSRSTVQPTRSADAASTPLPVSPSGLTNPSTAQQGNDLSNSTSASGKSNTYEPPSAGAGPTPGASATAASTEPQAASQSRSSQSLGTRPPANDGTLPNGTEGSTGSRGGAGKS